VDNYQAVEQAIDFREALVALIVPRDFAGRVESGRPAMVQLIVDGSDSNTATIAMGYAEAVAFTYSQEMIIRRTQRSGSRFPPSPLISDHGLVQCDLQSRNYLIPGSLR